MQAPACWGDGVQLTHITEFISTFFSFFLSHSCPALPSQPPDPRRIRTTLTDGHRRLLPGTAASVHSIGVRSTTDAICCTDSVLKRQQLQSIDNLQSAVRQALLTIINYAYAVSNTDFLQTSLHSLEQHLRQVLTTCKPRRNQVMLPTWSKNGEIKHNCTSSAMPTSSHTGKKASFTSHAARM